MTTVDMLRKYLALISSDWENRLATRVALSFIGMTLLLALLYGIGAYATIVSLIRKNEAIILKSRSDLDVQKVESALSALSVNVANLARNTIVVNALVDSFGRDTYLIPFLKSSRLLDTTEYRLSLCDFRGKVIASNNGTAGYDDAALLNSLIRKGEPIARLVPVSSGGMNIVLCYPVIYPATETAEGFLVLEASLARILSALESIDGDHDHVMRLVANGRDVWQSAIHYPFEISHETRLNVPAPLPALGLSLVVSMQHSSAIIWFTATFLVTFILSLWFSVRIAYRLSTFLTKRLVALSEASIQISASGIPDQTLTVTGHDEISRLAESFNTMIHRLRQSYDELEQRVDERTRQLEETNRVLDHENSVRRQLAAELEKKNLELQSSRDELEQRVAERTAELESALRHMESFSYSISHDLRTPLRAVDGYSCILLEESGPSLTADAQSYLQRISGNVRHMGELIDDLLTYSRLNRQPISLQQVNLTELARQVFAELQHEWEQRDIEPLFQDLPSCQADPILLRQVFVNLLANAVKFTRHTPRARIEFGGQPEEGTTIYFVKDNGAGFDMSYANKLFKVFQRLHPDREYEGTGVGLAIVQNIIHRHHGKVWAEGKEGEGATFFFTLGPAGDTQ